MAADLTPDSARDAAHFIDKWRARWPEWTVAEVFVPAAQRGTALAWAALQQELLDAAWRGEDPRPGEAKLAWWQEELDGWSVGRRRHPLAPGLQRLSADWAALGAALPTLAAARERPRNLADALAALQPITGAAAAVESVVLEGRADASVLAHCWLGARLIDQGDQAVALDALAAAPNTASRYWAGTLLEHSPAQTGHSVLRRLWAGLLRARLAWRAPSVPPHALGTLLRAWRAARN